MIDFTYLQFLKSTVIFANTLNLIVILIIETVRVIFGSVWEIVLSEE